MKYEAVSASMIYTSLLSARHNVLSIQVQPRHYLVLLGSDENYHIFDLGEGVDKESLAEGDSVKVFYVGELDRKDPAPVAVSIEKIDS